MKYRVKEACLIPTPEGDIELEAGDEIHYFTAVRLLIVRTIRPHRVPPEDAPEFQGDLANAVDAGVLQPISLVERVADVLLPRLFR